MKDINRRGFDAVIAEQNEKWKQRQMENARVAKGRQHVIKLMGEPGVQSEFKFVWKKQ